MKRIISTLFGLAILCLFAEARAVPTTVSFTGRLTTTSGPVSGQVNITFRLFDLATNGTVMWTEPRPNLTATNGLVYADLGALTTLDEGILLNAPLFLEIQVGAEVLTPRLPLQSVPYSIRSEISNSADTLGTIAPADVVTTVTATGGGLSAVRTGNTVSITGTGASGTAPINVAAGVVSLVTCSNNQVYKMSGGSWGCASDNDVPYTAVANGGINITGQTIGLLTTCAQNSVLKAGATAGTWACGSDNDVPYTAIANGGINVTGQTIGLLTTCAQNSVLKAGATAGTWACATDNDAGGDILGITTNSGSGLDGGCAGGTCTLTADPTDFNAIPINTYNSLSILVDTVYTTGEQLATTTVSAPGAGYIIVFFSADAYCSTCASGTTETSSLYVWLTTAATGTLSEYWFQGLNNSGGTTTWTSITVNNVFPVAAAGNVTIYARSGISSAGGETTRVDQLRMTAFFVPS